MMTPVVTKPAETDPAVTTPAATKPDEKLPAKTRLPATVVSRSVQPIYDPNDALNTRCLAPFDP